MGGGGGNAFMTMEDGSKNKATTEFNNKLRSSRMKDIFLSVVFHQKCLQRPTSAGIVG